MGLEVVDARKRLAHASKKWRRRRIVDIKGVAYHQTGGGDSLSKLAFYHTRSNHISKTGMPGVGYTIFVDKKGVTTLCNDLESITWSQGTVKLPGDENKMFLSVCFGGSFKPWPNSTEHPTTAQMERAALIWQVLKKHLGLTEHDLYGHYDFGKSACPGEALEDFIEAVNDSAVWEWVPFDLRTIKGQQGALMHYGLLNEEDVDGVFGPRSRRAMQAFQVTRGLPRTSRWNKLTTAEAFRWLLKGE